MKDDKDKQGLKMKYFILKPKGVDDYAQASRWAMQTYANAIHPTNPKLAKELGDWAFKERQVALKQTRDRR